MEGKLAGGMVVLAGILLTTNGSAQKAGRTAPDRIVVNRMRPGLITVHATSHRRLASTVADASVSIEVHGRDLRGTARQLGRQAQALLAFLRTQNAEQLRTEGTSFDPEIQEQRNAPDRIKGYTGRISVSFRTAPDQLPLVLAGCLDNGATALGQFGSSPRGAKVDAARRDMVEEATGRPWPRCGRWQDRPARRWPASSWRRLTRCPGRYPCRLLPSSWRIVRRDQLPHRRQFRRSHLWQATPTCR